MKTLNESVTSSDSDSQKGQDAPEEPLEEDD